MLFTFCYCIMILKLEKTLLVECDENVDDAAFVKKKVKEVISWQSMFIQWFKPDINGNKKCDYLEQKG